VFRPIHEKYNVASLLNDLDGVEDSIIENQTINIRNLCRVLQYLRDKELVDFAGTMMRKIDWEIKKI